MKGILVKFCCLAFFFLTASSQAAPTLDRVIAIVNSGIITQSELDFETQQIQKQISRSEQPMPPLDILRRQILEKLILDEVQLQWAKAVGMQIDEAMLDQAITHLAQEQKMTPLQYREKLEKEGIPFSAFRKILFRDITISRAHQMNIGSQIMVSNQEVEHFLKSNEGLQATGTEYKVGHILIDLPEAPTPEVIAKTKNRAEDIFNRLKKGEDFHQLALRESRGSHALSGGDLGWRKISDLPTLFVNPVSNLSVGELAAPLRSVSGFHIIKLLDKRIGNDETVDIEETHVRHILIKADAMTSDHDAKTKLLNLREKLKTGEDFAILAKTYSADLQTVSKGGDLGWVTPEVLVPEFREVMNTLPLNEISSPFKTGFGWHIAQVLGRRYVNQADAILEKRARRLIYQRKFGDKLEAWQRQLRDAAFIKIIAEDEFKT